MADITTKRSPIHHVLQARKPTWCYALDTPIVVRFQTEDAERQSMKRLGLCDLSGLSKLGIKGHDSASWLESKNIDVPAAIYESRRLADDGLIVRIATDEFFLESGISNQTVPTLSSELESISQYVFRVEFQEATFLLVGTRAIDVLAQTCGINFDEAVPRRLIYSRVAGVSCGIFPDSIGEVPAYRFWIDPSYAAYLWETLEQICHDLGGNAIGAGCLFPDWP
jgi:sarcosine oxidase subunit gamma